MLAAVAAPAPGARAVAFSLTAGDPVGPAFPGLRVALAADVADDALAAWTTQRTFYIVTLLAVMGVTLIGGAVFWWDVRRELRTADLRAQFVASVSHELRTPLTAIRMFAETLLMERPLDAADRAEYLETIVNESERLTRLVNNVLDFSRMERGEKVYHLEPASLPVIARDAARAMRYPLSRQGFELPVGVAIGTVRAGVGSTGAFRIDGLHGRHAVRIEGLPPGWMLASVRRDGVELADTALDVLGGRTLAGVEVLVSTHAGSLQGRVVDAAGRPVAGGAAIVFAADASRWRYPSRFVRSAPIQPDGTFRAPALPAGDYLVTRVPTLTSGWDAPDSLEPLRLGATAVRLAAGQRRTLTETSPR